MELKTFLKIWIIVFTAVVIWLLVDNRRLADQANKRATENTHLINQERKTQRKLIETQAAIQRSRLESCKANYTSQLEAFAPFAPKQDDPTTSRNEVQDFKLFTDNIKKKRSHCAEQVAPKPPKKSKEKK